MLKNLFRKNSISENEGPIEAGQNRGMSKEEVFSTYFQKRSDILKLLRIYSRLDVSEVAGKLGISESEFSQIEKSENMVPFQLVPKLAEIFKVDLKTLLVALGHANRKVIENNKKIFKEFAMATRYSGPEFTEQEKIDLENLFKLLVEQINRKEDNK
jgi:transcriptional regulator with XRE-family HTH domain